MKELNFGVAPLPGQRLVLIPESCLTSGLAAAGAKLSGISWSSMPTNVGITAETRDADSYKR